MSSQLSSIQPSTVQQNFQQRRMAVERRRYPNFQLWMSKRDSTDQARQVAFHVQPKCKKIRDYLDLIDALRSKVCDCRWQIGLAEFEERRFDGSKFTGIKQIGREFSHSFISGFNARSVRKENDTRHAN
jgi:hypothetical protein